MGKRHTGSATGRPTASAVIVRSGTTGEVIRTEAPLDADPGLNPGQQSRAFGAHKRTKRLERNEQGRK